MAQKYTRNMIRNVFIEMLDERPFDEITVTDLVTRCEINRKTFYYYYQDLYAVLTEIFESELEAVLGGVKEHVTWEEGIAQAMQIALRHKRAVYHVYHSMQRESLENTSTTSRARSCAAMSSGRARGFTPVRGIRISSPSFIRAR